VTVVVADSSPLNYLTLIGSVELLHRLYGTVLVPYQVVLELTDTAAPQQVRNWASAPPGWIDIRMTPSNGDATLSHLDPGEQSAIILAESETGALLLIDDAAGRLEASRRGISNTGTLGVLRAGAVRGLIDLPSALARLLDTNFRVSTKLVEDLLAEDAERRRFEVE
jgi:predicted nucleic acid-binding protein